MSFINNNNWSRRKFLGATAAGAGLIVVPGFLAGCGGPIIPPSAISSASAVAPAQQQLYFSSFGIDENVINTVLSEAMSGGGDFADLFFQHNITNYLGLEDGEVNKAYSNIELGCGVRVVKGDQTGFAFTEDLTLKALVSAAKTAAIVANESAKPLSDSIQRMTVPNYYPVETSWDNIGIEQKMPMLVKINDIAMAYDKRIIKVRVSLSDTTSRIMIATSEGKRVEDVQPMTTVYCTCVAEDKDKREDNYYSYGTRQGFEFYSDAAIKELAETAAKRTIVLFDADQPPAGEMPVVLAPGFSGILLHEAIGHGMEADFNRKGTSVYSDKIGKKIAPDFVSIVDDGTNQGWRGTINIDDEGNETEKTFLVKDGILESYMHDRISAKHYNVKPTGNGRRESYQYPPIPRMRNTYMLNGPHNPEDIIKSVKKGIYAETFTNGQVQIGSGDFSFYLKNGYLIEDGKLTAPIKDANLIGFGPKILEQTEMVGNDLSLSSGAGTCGKDGQRVPVGMGLPTVLCNGISVGGANNG